MTTQAPEEREREINARLDEIERALCRFLEPDERRKLVREYHALYEANQRRDAA